MSEDTCVRSLRATGQKSDVKSGLGECKHVEEREGNSPLALKAVERELEGRCLWCCVAGLFLQFLFLAFP